MSIRPVLGSRASIGDVLGSGRGGGGNGLLTGLVAYWGLDEAGGANNALDKHSGGLTLTQTGSPGADTGKVYATARTFDGLSHYFTRASSSTLQPGNADFAIAAWIFPISTPSIAGGILTKDNTLSGGREFSLQINSSRFGRFVVSANGISATGVNTAALSLNAWHLIIAWHDATADKIYISANNGTATEAAHSDGAYSTTTILALGNFEPSTNLRFSGRLGPVAFWKNRTLDATARAALYNGGAGLAYSAFTA